MDEVCENAAPYEVSTTYSTPILMLYSVDTGALVIVKSSSITDTR